jgi:acyl dehydratase
MRNGFSGDTVAVGFEVLSKRIERGHNRMAALARETVLAGERTRCVRR